jgi:hypothetical protein
VRSAPLLPLALLAMLPVPAAAYAIDDRPLAEVLASDHVLLVEVTATRDLALEVEPHPTSPVRLEYQRVDFRLVRDVFRGRKNRTDGLRYFLAGGRNFSNVRYVRFAPGDLALVALEETPTTGFVHLRCSDVAVGEHFVFSRPVVEATLAAGDLPAVPFLRTLFTRALADASLRERYYTLPEGDDGETLDREAMGHSLLRRLVELAEVQVASPMEWQLDRLGPPLTHDDVAADLERLATDAPAAVREAVRRARTLLAERREAEAKDEAGD